MVVKLIVELLAPTERMRICDPTAGSGGMLTNLDDLTRIMKSSRRDPGQGQS